MDGLNEDYVAFITFVLSRSEPFSISEIEALLMAQEDMLQRFRKSEVSLVQANVSQTFTQEPRFGGRGAGGHKGRGDRNSRRGRNSWNNSNRPPCQLCANLGTLFGSVSLGLINPFKILLDHHKLTPNQTLPILFVIPLFLPLHFIIQEHIWPSLLP